MVAQGDSLSGVELTRRLPSRPSPRRLQSPVCGMSAYESGQHLS